MKMKKRKFAIGLFAILLLIIVYSFNHQTNLAAKMRQATSVRNLSLSQHKQNTLISFKAGSRATSAAAVNANEEFTPPVFLGVFGTANRVSHGDYAAYVSADAERRNKARTHEISLGLNKEIHAKETELQRRATALHSRMTVDEVTAILGTPTQVIALRKLQADANPYNVPISLEEFGNCEDPCVFVYSPNGKTAYFYDDSFQKLACMFAADKYFEKSFWYSPIPSLPPGAKLIPE
jgi:hypothetical protein